MQKTPRRQPRKPGEAISQKEAKNQTLSTINNRLEEDKILTSRRKYGKDAIPENLVLSTWSGTLQNESSIPENWLRVNGVLVGIPPRRSRLSPTHQCVKAFPRDGHMRIVTNPRGAPHSQPTLLSTECTASSQWVPPKKKKSKDLIQSGISDHPKLIGVSKMSENVNGLKRCEAKSRVLSKTFCGTPVDVVHS